MHRVALVALLSLLLLLLSTATTRATATAPAFNATLSVAALHYSGMAYCHYGGTSHVTPVWRPTGAACTDITALHSVRSFEARSGFGYVGVDDARRAVVLAFEGTDPLQWLDWLHDLWGGMSDRFNCTLNARRSALVHRGFCAYYTQLRDAGVTAAALELAAAHADYALLITGHSLGAAAASLAYADIAALVAERSSSPALLLYTFGEPRTGDSEFAALFDSRHAFRVVHDADVVPHLPWCTSSPFGSCATPPKPGAPRQRPTLVQFPATMTPASSDYRVCSRTVGDDPACSVFGSSVSQHLHYYGVYVSEACCPAAAADDDRVAARSLLRSYNLLDNDNDSDNGGDLESWRRRIDARR